jgi:hypothetical protein
MINEIVNEMLREKNIANQHLLETLGITADNAEAYEICVNDEGEIVRVQRVMKATIWEKKQDAN